MSGVRLSGVSAFCEMSIGSVPLFQRVDDCRTLVLEAAGILRSGGEPEAVVAILSKAAIELAQARDAANYQDRQKGKRFEREFSDLATERGLHVAPPTHSLHDCVVNSLRVQCKSVDGASCYLTCVPVIGRTYRGYERGDWDVLAMRRNGSLVIIPAEMLTNESNGRILNQLRFEDWMSWRDRWDVFGEGFEVRRHTQKLLW